MRESVVIDRPGGFWLVCKVKDLQRELHARALRLEEALGRPRRPAA